MESMMKIRNRVIDQKNMPRLVPVGQALACRGICEWPRQAKTRPTRTVQYLSKFVMYDVMMNKDLHCLAEACLWAGSQGNGVTGSSLNFGEKAVRNELHWCRGGVGSSRFGITDLAVVWYKMAEMGSSYCERNSSMTKIRRYFEL